MAVTACRDVATPSRPGRTVRGHRRDVMHALTTYRIGAVVARKSHTYGAIGIAVAVLSWVFVFGRILVALAGVNATLWRQQHPLEAGQPDTGTVPPRNPV